MLDQQPELTTERLVLRLISIDDASFILRLLNDETFIRFIGDRKVRNEDQALNYVKTLQERHHSNAEFAFAVTLRGTDEAIGICSLFKRESLDAPDIGFAFLAEYRKRGYAFESAFATLEFAKSVLQMKRVVAVCDGQNAQSIALLKKLGLHFESQINFGDHDELSELYAIEFEQE